MDGADRSLSEKISFMEMLGSKQRTKSIVGNDPSRLLHQAHSSTADNFEEYNTGKATESDSILQEQTNKDTEKRKTVPAGRRIRKIPCKVCNAKMGSKANLKRHMKTHWTMYNKMEDLLKPITIRRLHQELICISYNSKKSNLNSQEDEVTKNFSCHVCYDTFSTGNKLGKHMDKHREIYNRMKELQENNSSFREDTAMATSSERTVKIISDDFDKDK